MHAYGLCLLFSTALHMLPLVVMIYNHTRTCSRRQVPTLREISVVEHSTWARVMAPILEIAHFHVLDGTRCLYPPGAANSVCQRSMLDRLIRGV